MHLLRRAPGQRAGHRAVVLPDANGDKSAQTNEILASDKPLATSGNWSATNPTFVGTQNTIDPNLKNDTTDEFIVGGSREIGHGFAVDLNYTWRRYGNFSSSLRNGVTSADYIEAHFTPTAAQCPVAGARCETVTYFYPSFVPSLDVFNVMNSNTVQAVRGIQNASNANNIQAIVAPRVLRFGVRVNW